MSRGSDTEDFGRFVSTEHDAAAELLRRFMADEGWTVATLAEHTGVSVSVIRLYLGAQRMPKPDRDTGHRLVEGFHPEVRDELFDAWGYDANQRKPRRAPLSAPPEGFLEILLRIEAKLDLLIDMEQRPDALGATGDPKVRPIRGQRRNEEGTG